MGRTLVVGGGSEIGAAVARALVGLDETLELWGRDPGRLKRAARRCRSADPTASITTRVVDLRDPARVQKAVEGLRDAPLSTAVWTPGIFDWAHPVEADPERWADVVDVGLTAAARWSAHVAPLLVAAAPSRLLFLGSLAGRIVFPNNATYVAAKHGLDALSRALSEDLNPLGVAVTILSPSVVDAGAGRLAPEGPRLRPDDVASAVHWVLERPSRIAIRELTITAIPAPPAPQA